METSRSIATIAMHLRSWRDRLPRLSLAGQFMLYSLVILVAGALVIGSLIAGSIAQGVINRTMTVTALYIDSFISPHLQELADSRELSAENAGRLKALLTDTPLGNKIVSFKIWLPDGEIVFAIDERLVGRSFPMSQGLQVAFTGEVSSHMSSLQKEEHLYERERWDRLVETYSPVFQQERGNVIAVAEFYQVPDNLEAEISQAQRRGWMVVGSATLLMFLLLNGTVRRASNLILRQNRELQDTVHELTSLHGIVDASIATLSVDRSLDLLLQRLVSAMQADAGVVLLLDGSSRLEVRAADGVTTSSLEAAVPALEAWMHGLSPRADVQSWQRGERLASGQSGVLNALDLCSALAAPLVARGEVLGIVLVGNRSPCTYSPATLRLVRAVCERAALYLQNAHLAERLQQVAAQKTQTDEQALQRIAADLHDGPAQEVSLALLRLETLYRSMLPQADSTVGRHDFEMIHAALETALGEIRQVSSGLRLPELEPLTLVQVAQKACADHEAVTESRVDFETTALQERASMPMKIAIYRVIQEALRNAYRHGKAREPRVRLSQAANMLRLEVDDEGPGFVPDDLPPDVHGGHLGLRGMQERVELLGGRLVIHSTSGQGTVVTAYLPLEPREEEGADGSHSYPGGR